MSNEVSVQYALSGGGKVVVHKPFGGDHYVALVEMSGEYPEPGKLARNNGRDEFIVILEGTFEVTVNDGTQELSAGGAIFVPNGAYYRIVGAGKSLVVVRDEQGGSTEIVDEKLPSPNAL